MWRGICWGTPRSRRDECRYLWKLSSLWTLLSGADLPEVDPQPSRATRAHTHTHTNIQKMFYLNDVTMLLGWCLLYRFVRLGGAFGLHALCGDLTVTARYTNSRCWHSRPLISLSSGIAGQTCCVSGLSNTHAPTRTHSLTHKSTVSELTMTAIRKHVSI